MKILFLTYMDFPIEGGGFQQQVREIEKNLKQKGVSITWCSLTENKLLECDLLHVFSSVPSLFPIMKKARSIGKPVVLTPMVGSRKRSLFYLKNALKASAIPQMFTSIKEGSLTIREADRWTPLSEYEKEKLVSVYGINRNKIDIIPNGIDDIYFNDDLVDVKLPFKDYYLVVGRIEPNKNQLNLIKAMSKVAGNLIVVGEPGVFGEEYYLKCRQASKNNIFFWGKENNKLVMKTLYQKAKLTIIPSFSEMVPLVVFESLKMHTPVLCTKYSSLSDKDDIPGLFFTGTSEHELAQKIIRYNELNFERRNISRRGIFSWEEIAEKYLEIYQSLLTPKELTKD